MRHRRFLWFILLMPALFLLSGLVVMSLWNWLLPDLLGAKTITFAQALGLMLLSRLLLGGFRGRWAGGGFPGMMWRRRMMRRWEKMTPEERERFRAGMRSGFCGPHGGSHGSATS
ncbi:MAG TPA: hypothetical protein VFY29_00380 [Terriglobia bacterium]|nr:hypothetical protein [Terriglobia bacterium]